MSDKPVHKFKLRDLVHRIRKLTIEADVVIDDKVVNDFPVGWVKLRGSCDPKYIASARNLLQDFNETVSKEPSIEEMTESAEYTLNASVVAAIVEWDSEFFGQEFSQEYAMELFKDREFILIFNQIANYMQESIDFLPVAR